MPARTKEEVLAELEALTQRGQQLVASYRPSEYVGESTSVAEHELRAFVTSAAALAANVAGRDSEYYGQIAKPERNDYLNGNSRIINSALGALVALRDHVRDGWLASLEARIRAAVHDDLLVQAEELLTANYHIAAIVLAGGVLENHLRQLAVARNLLPAGNGSLSRYNEALRERVYDQPTWRRIQQIGDLRNQAAHGHGAQVDPGGVREALPFVRRIITEYPA
jgi:hypothetical protein